MSLSRIVPEVVVGAVVDAELRLIGIDPGLRITGYAVLVSRGRQARVLEAGVIKTTSKLSMGDRLVELRDGIEEVLSQYQPTSMAVEQLFSHYKHPRTAIAMGHARGVLLEAAARRGITIESITPKQAKKTITGSGAADKIQMQRAIVFELALDRIPEPADVADAMAIALCLHHRRWTTPEEVQ